jgi:tetratricopeptide (TPR) repeat protein
MRRYEEGESFVQRAKSKNPAATRILDTWLARVKLAKGDLMSARALTANPNTPEALDTHFDAALYARDYAGALTIIAEAPAELVEDLFYLKSPDSTGEARVYRAQGDHGKAERAFSALRRWLDSNSDEESRNNWYYQLAGYYDAGRGHNEEAIREARMAVDLNPIARDPVNGTTMVLRLATVYAWAGDRDRAIEQLEILANCLRKSLTESFASIRIGIRCVAMRGSNKLVASLAPKMASR